MAALEFHKVLEPQSMAPNGLHTDNSLKLIEKGIGRFPVYFCNDDSYQFPTDVHHAHPRPHVQAQGDWKIARDSPPLLFHCFGFDEIRLDYFDRSWRKLTRPFCHYLSL